MLATTRACNAPVCRSVPTVGPRQASTARRVVRVTTRAASAGGPSPPPLQPFSGCNSYHLLSEAIYNNDQYVDETLEVISKCGFNVVRMWAFLDNDPEKGLQRAPGVVNVNAMDKLKEVLDKMRGKGLKAMLCLTNCLPDYGGMLQYVRWAEARGHKGSILLGDSKEAPPQGHPFYYNDKAREYYMNYVTYIVDTLNTSHGDVIHSWDICNEPRNKGNSDKASQKTVEFIHDTAKLIKQLDPTHYVTVGSEGFFGKPGSSDWSDNGMLATQCAQWQDGICNYASTTYEGCDWLSEAKCPELDFVCVHPYLDQVHKTDDKLTTVQLHRYWLDTNIEWIKKHADACKTLLGNKPLVVQEFNMPASAAELRLEYFEEVKKLVNDENSPVTGAMVWMVAAGTRTQDQNANHFDQYTEYISSTQDLEGLTKMCTDIKQCSKALTYAR